MSGPAASPLITELSWGRLQIEDGRVFKDAKLWPGGAREWNWRETGTAHAPGIQPADLAELLEQDVTVVVLSQGMHGRLQVQPAALELLRQQGISSHVLPTPRAVILYNELREGEAVGGLFHSTC
jgi:hypothetical protein